VNGIAKLTTDPPLAEKPVNEEYASISFSLSV
jgi:hypothetical protein